MTKRTRIGACCVLTLGALGGGGLPFLWWISISDPFKHLGFVFTFVGIPACLGALLGSAGGAFGRMLFLEFCRALETEKANLIGTLVGGVVGVVAALPLGLLSFAAAIAN